MATELIINATFSETRIALLTNGEITELHVERKSDKGIVGNVYKGRVVRVLPGMQAAFVDIGLDRAAFLYVGDIHTDATDIAKYVDNEEEPEIDIANEEEAYTKRNLQSRHKKELGNIQDLIKEGQEIVVQVAKESIGTKGARITTHVSLPGRYVVYMPTIDHIGVSRKIQDDDERRRLRRIVDESSRKSGGFIIRTIAANKNQDFIKQDIEYLIRIWEQTQKNSKKSKAPALIHTDLDIVLRAVRDMFTDEVDKLIIDSEKSFKSIRQFVDTYNPRLKSKVVLYDKKKPLFDHYGIEEDIQGALVRKVWLKSGGYLIVDQSEALTSIDVNTGRYVGKRDLEDTILKTNLESAEEMAHQLRLRNIGGIIVLDFIDMEKQQNREKVYRVLNDELKKDKAKTNTYFFSELGLVEMTRKRVREDLIRTLTEPCYYCEGKGFVKGAETMCYEIFREIFREINDIDSKQIVVYTHPDVADLLLKEEKGGIKMLEERFDKKIIIKKDQSFHQEQFEIFGET